MTTFKKIISPIASIKLTVVLLLILFLLTLWGTLYQVNHGLYDAQQTFFYSFGVMLFTVIPFPGVQLTMWILFLNLCAGAIIHLKYTIKHTGIILIHLGILTLLGGGFYSFSVSNEGYLSLEEQDMANVALSYQDWEVALVRTKNNNKDTLALDLSPTLVNNPIDIGTLKMTITTYLKNSVISSGILFPKPTKKNPEENIPGIILSLDGSNIQPEENVNLWADQPHALTINTKPYTLILQRKRQPLPISLSLIDFKRELHPETQVAKSYESKVTVLDKNTARPALISMNEPLRYGSFTFFQSSFAIDTIGNETSVFAVVYNPARWFPYIASVITTFGLILHFLIALFRRLRFQQKRATRSSSLCLLLFSVLLFSTSHTEANTSLNLNTFKQLTVLDDGRLKPIDTFAQNTLLQLSGKRTFEKEPAINWLAKVLFTPKDTHHDNVFMINHPQLLHALDIQAHPNRRYKFSQLQPHLHKLHEFANQSAQIDKDKRTAIESEFFSLFNNVILYISLSDSFEFLRPQSFYQITSETLSKFLKIKTNTSYSFLSILKSSHALVSLTAPLKDKDITNWTTEEKEGFELTRRLFHDSKQFGQVQIPRIIPLSLNGDITWQSAWSILPQGISNPNIAPYFHALEQMSMAYKSFQQETFDLSIKEFLNSPNYNQTNPIKFELFYNKLKPFSYATWLYGLALCLILISFLFTSVSINKWIQRSIFFPLISAFSLHTLGLILRILILERPPVSTLYETFIFVSWICVFLSFFICNYFSRAIGLFSATISGLVILLIAGKYALDGDTLKVLVAVLNSNFWLSTHVITITMGYAGVCLAGIIGHFYLIQSAMNHRSKTKQTYRIVMGVLGFGLTLSFLGTVLGGIWADQSWGRFWGWDPKENGALMIVLWCAMIFHARISNLLGELEIVVSVVLSILVVLFAWFGVNQLGVGLHSYGFTTGVWRNLILFSLFEIGFIGVCIYKIRRHISIVASS